jgi:hypothetical protein
MVAEHRPRAAAVGLEVDLEDLAGGGATHHHVLEALVSRGGEQGRVKQERDIDPAFVDGVRVHDLVVAASDQGIDGVAQPRHYELVLDLAHAEQIRAGAAVHLRDHRRQLRHLPIT